MMMKLLIITDMKGEKIILPQEKPNYPGKTREKKG
jgi:hypothetical protein